MMQPSPVDRNEDDAARWVARMDAEDWDEALEAELQLWLADDPRRHGALLKAQASWMTLDKPDPAVSADADGSASGLSRRLMLFAGGGMAIAASVAGAFLLFPSGTSYTTSVGEIRRIPLPDGSTAAINTSSRVEVTIAETERRVRIDDGEVWFQVIRDPARPFVVEAGRVRVQALGTAFSVRRRDAGADILVTEGVVEAWADGAEGHKIRLGAGSRAFVANNAAIERRPDEPASVDRALAWRSGKINLVGTPLADAMAEFNRYNRRQLVLVDPALGGEQLDGIFRTDDPQGFAIAVRSGLGVPVDLGDPTAIRIGRPRT